MPVRSSPNESVFLRRPRFDEELKNHVSGTTHSSKPAGCMEALILSVSPGCTHKRPLWYASIQAFPLSEEIVWEVRIPCANLYRRLQSEHTSLDSHSLFIIYNQTIIASFNSATLSLPCSNSTTAKANSMAAPGPFPVMILPSFSTIAPVQSAPSRYCSKPG